VATLVVAKWTGDLDIERLRSRLDHPGPDETENPEDVHADLDVHMAQQESRLPP
jgi:aerobic C4-dicarboxylate transport protein